MLYVNIGATCGAVLAFLSARYLLGSRLQESYGAQLAKFNGEMERNGVRYLLTLRLIPVFPFFLVNFLSGLTRVHLSTFTWTTAAGIIPGTVVFAYAGHQLETVHSVGDIFTGKVLSAFLLLGHVHACAGSHRTHEKTDTAAFCFMMPTAIPCGILLT